MIMSSQCQSVYIVISIRIGYRMMNLQELVNIGSDIKNGVQYVPPESGIWRTYSVYKLQDRLAYSTWKNQSIIYLQSILKDEGAVKRFEEQGDLFEKHYYKPVYLDNMIGILNAYLQSGITSSDESQESQKFTSKKVFVVHGHAEAVNQEVARTIEQLGLEAVILRERPNSGKTIIEKFEEYAKDVCFAVILLTADDKVEGGQLYRARQNVVFEMGFFMGALGRERVMCMLQENVEKPGDIDGVVYTRIDKFGIWKYSLVKELKSCGYEVDANKVL